MKFSLMLNKKRVDFGLKLQNLNRECTKQELDQKVPKGPDVQTGDVNDIPSSFIDFFVIFFSRRKGK